MVPTSTKHLTKHTSIPKHHVKCLSIIYSNQMTTLNLQLIFPNDTRLQLIMRIISTISKGQNLMMVLGYSIFLMRRVGDGTYFKGKSSCNKYCPYSLYLCKVEEGFGIKSQCLFLYNILDLMNRKGISFCLYS